VGIPVSANNNDSKDGDSVARKLLNFATDEKNQKLAVQAAKGGLKIGIGALGVKGGAALTATGLGAIPGVPMMGIGASEFTEGATLIGNTLEGKLQEGYNPGREFAKERIGDKWGDTAYDAVALISNVGGLFVKVPLVLGTADSMNRATSIFGVKISGWENGMVIPGIGIYLPQTLNQIKTTISSSVGGYKVGADVANAERKD
jgi:hypothetical protein